MSRNKKQDSDISKSILEIPEANLMSIDSLAYQTQISALKEENSLLVKQNIGYSQTVDQLLQQLEEKSSYIAQLEATINSRGGDIGEVVPLIRSRELVMLEGQIEKFHMTAMTRLLTLDETRQLDLLIKNKRLIEGNSTEIPGRQKSVKELPMDSMLLIAKTPLKSE